MKLGKHLFGLTRLLPTLALTAMAALLIFDLIAFWGFWLRPLASIDGVEIAAWAILGGTAAAAGLRWALLNDARLRFQAAGAVALMVAFSALHPWQNGRAVEGPVPARLGDGRALAADAVVTFERGPLTEGRAERY